MKIVNVVELLTQVSQLRMVKALSLLIGYFIHSVEMGSFLVLQQRRNTVFSLELGLKILEKSHEMFLSTFLLSSF